MVLRPDERLEEQPGTPGGETQCFDVVVGELRCHRLQRRQADPSTDHRRERPAHHERGSQPSVLRPKRDDQRCGRDGEHDATGHAPVEARQGEVAIGLGLRRGHPLEEVPSGHVHPNEGSQDRVGHQPRLVSQEGDPEQHVGEGECDVFTDGSDVTALGDALSSRQQPHEHGECRGDGCRDHHECRPHDREISAERPCRDQGCQRQR